MNSLWIETTEKKAYPKLEKNVSCDVCIIGGGITGLTLGYLLSKKGISFKILERNEICSGVTANTTGNTTNLPTCRLKMCSQAVPKCGATPF